MRTYTIDDITLNGLDKNDKTYEKMIFEIFIGAIEKIKKNYDKDFKIIISEPALEQIVRVLQDPIWGKHYNIKKEHLNILGTTIQLKKEKNNFSKYEMNYLPMTREIMITPYYPDGYKEENKNKTDKENKNMLKILEIYGNKKMKEIEKKYDKQLNDLEENDPISVYVKQTEEAIKEMLNSDNVSLVLNSDTMGFTKETVDKREEIIDTIRMEKSKIKAQIEEITALLELAPNYEEKLQILRDYGIIDKKKNIIL